MNNRGNLVKRNIGDRTDRTDTAAGQAAEIAGTASSVAAVAQCAARSGADTGNQSAEAVIHEQ